MQVSYGVSNLRRIKNMGAIPIKPLTILVGRNSAGKSTYLRTLPLIRQSLEKRGGAPILWYGNYVDYGNIEVAVPKGEEDKREAVFEFKFTDFYDGAKKNHRRMWYAGVRRNRILQMLDNYNSVTLKFTICGNPQTKGKKKHTETELKKIEFFVERKTDDHKDQSTIKASVDQGTAVFSAEFKDNGDFDFNFLNSKSDLFEKYILAGKVNFFSLFLFNLNFQPKKDSTTPRNYKFDADEIVLKIFRKNYKPKKRKIRRATGEEEYYLEDDFMRARETIHSVEKLVTNNYSEAVVRLKEDLGVGDEKKIEELLSYVNIARHIRAYNFFARHLYSMFSNIRYLGPARTEGSRYNRIQELQVNEIEPDGSNLPTYLDSLEDREMERFSNWVKEIYNFGVTVNRSSGHTSIELVPPDDSGDNINVADTGYGVSQILPILGMLWAELNATISADSTPIDPDVDRILAIEQPELHLHPAHQAKLADCFAQAIKEKKFKLLVETHSEAMINRIGNLIYDGELDSESVQIVIFGTQDDLTSPTEVNIATFSKDGALNNWPFGFFGY